MNEKFVLIKEYPNYAVSNFGRIKNVKTNKILKTQIKNGYESISLCKNSVVKSFRVHRLVALAFIRNKFNKPDVNHIDGNKLNNKSWNLEWVTRQENTIHAQNNGLKNDNKPIKVINITNGETIIFDSIGECSKYLDTNRGSIHRVLTGKRKKHKGYTFEYL